MDKTYKSDFLRRNQLIVALLILGIFGGAAVFLLVNTLYRGEQWYILVDSQVMKFSMLYIAGILIAGLYFARDYYFVNALKVSFNDGYINFKGHWIDKHFHIADLRDYRPSRVIYGWFKKEKHLLRFKNRSDNRKYQMFIILKKEDAPEFEKAMLEARKSIM
jgi:hypothetical protein